MGNFGHTMVAHGEEFDAESQLGNNLVAIGQANERISGYQEVFLEQMSGTWGASVEQTAAMMKDYQASPLEE